MKKVLIVNTNNSVDMFGPYMGLPTSMDKGYLVRKFKELGREVQSIRQLPTTKASATTCIWGYVQFRIKYTGVKMSYGEWMSDGENRRWY